MRLTIEQTLEPGTVTTLYGLYHEAFGPLATRAVARHVLTADEFAAEMADPRLDKYVAWTDDDHPVGLTTIATDLSAVPWISHEYYAANYPEHFARGAIFYLGITCVARDRRYAGAYPLMMDAVVRRMTEARAVCGYDICAYNDGRGMSRSIRSLCRAADARLEHRDVQTYYAMVFGSPADPAGADREADHDAPQR